MSIYSVIAVLRREFELYEGLLNAELRWHSGAAAPIGWVSGVEK